MCEEFGAGFGGQPSHELSDAVAKRIPGDGGRVASADVEDESEAQIRPASR